MKPYYVARVSLTMAPHPRPMLNISVPLWCFKYSTWLLQVNLIETSSFPYLSAYDQVPIYSIYPWQAEVQADRHATGATTVTIKSTSIVLSSTNNINNNSRELHCPNNANGAGYWCDATDKGLLLGISDSWAVIVEWHPDPVTTADWILGGFGMFCR